MGMGDFNSDDHYIYYCGQESFRRNGVAIMVNKRVQNAVLRCYLKNDRMISVHFQGKPFNIRVIQAYAPTSNAEEAEVKRFYEDLQDVLKLTPKKDVLFIIGDWNAKVVSPRLERGHARALSSRAVAAVSPFPSRGSRDLCLSLEVFPKGCPTCHLGVCRRRSSA